MRAGGVNSGAFRAGASAPFPGARFLSRPRRRARLAWRPCALSSQWRRGLTARLPVGGRLRAVPQQPDVGERYTGLPPWAAGVPPTPASRGTRPPRPAAWAAGPVSPRGPSSPRPFRCREPFAWPTGVRHGPLRYDASVDVASASNDSTQTYLGVANRSAQLPNALVVRLHVPLPHLPRPHAWPGHATPGSARLIGLAPVGCQQRVWGLFLALVLWHLNP